MTIKMKPETIKRRSAKRIQDRQQSRALLVNRLKLMAEEHGQDSIWQELYEEAVGVNEIKEKTAVGTLIMTSGYAGLITGVYSWPMVEVKLESGEICVDVCDLISQG